MELTDIKYLSEKRIKELNKLNIYNCEDLINNFPRNYLNLTKITPIKYSYHNDCIDNSNMFSIFALGLDLSFRT